MSETSRLADYQVQEIVAAILSLSGDTPENAVGNFILCKEQLSQQREINPMKGVRRNPSDKRK